MAGPEDVLAAVEAKMPDWARPHERRPVDVRKPYYGDALVTLYQGDAREVAADMEIGPESVLVTDPVWPNPGNVAIAGTEDPAGLLAAVVGNLVARGLRRAIVVLGCDSDPRILASVPLRFRRLVWLRFAVPSYKGPILQGADVAYVFGDFRMAYRGQVVWPGEILANQPRERWRTAHPCPRKYQHMEGLVRGYTRPDDHLLDPFAGSGTIVDAAARNGRRVTACEIDPRWCLETAERARIATAQGNLPNVVNAAIEERPGEDPSCT